MNSLTSKETLTSLELVSQINIFRKQEGNKNDLRHDNLLQIIRDEFEEEISLLKIQESTYKNERGREYPMFILTLNQSKQILMRESKFVRKAMIHYIEELENALKIAINPKQNLLLSIIQSSTEVERAVALNKYELEYVKPLELKIEQDKPLVEFANQVSSSSDSILVRQFAKLLADENIKLGEKKLYQWFRDNGYVCKNSTEATQKAINQGLFEIVERTVKTPYGEKITQTTKVTGRGQIYFTEKLRVK